MAIADVLVVSVVALSSVFGILRGLVREALSLFFWVAAGLLAATFDRLAAAQLTGLISAAPVRLVAGFALIFVITVFIGGLITNLISKLTSAAGLGGADRALGALFGLIRGVLIVTLLAVLAVQFDFTRGWYEDAVSVPYLLRLADDISGLLGIDPAALRAGLATPV